MYRSGRSFPADASSRLRQDENAPIANPPYKKKIPQIHPAQISPAEPDTKARAPSALISGTSALLHNCSLQTHTGQDYGLPKAPAPSLLLTTPRFPAPKW